MYVWVLCITNLTGIDPNWRDRLLSGSWVIDAMTNQWPYAFIKPGNMAVCDWIAGSQKKDKLKDLTSRLLSFESKLQESENAYKRVTTVMHESGTFTEAAVS